MDVEGQLTGGPGGGDGEESGGRHWRGLQEDGVAVRPRAARAAGRWIVVMQLNCFYFKTTSMSEPVGGCAVADEQSTQARLTGSPWIREEVMAPTGIGRRVRPETGVPPAVE